MDVSSVRCSVCGSSFFFEDVATEIFLLSTVHRAPIMWWFPLLKARDLTCLGDQTAIKINLYLDKNAEGLPKIPLRKNKIFVKAPLKYFLICYCFLCAPQISDFGVRFPVFIR